MWEFIRSLFGRRKPTPPRDANCRDSAGSREYTVREGNAAPVDQAFKAWTSGDLPRMLNALGKKTNLVDRHFLLMNLVAETYRLRSDPEMAERCLEVAQIHVGEFRAIAPVLKREMNGILPRVPTFQHFATLLAERGQFESAIRVCEQAIAYGLSDGSKGGFEGRIERIKKQQAKRDKVIRAEPKPEVR